VKLEKKTTESVIEPVLIILDLDKEMKVETNASDFVIRGVLLMKYKNEK